MKDTFVRGSNASDEGDCPRQPAVVIEPTHNDATLNAVTATTAVPDGPLLPVAETLTFEPLSSYFSGPRDFYTGPLYAWSTRATLQV